MTSSQPKYSVKLAKTILAIGCTGIIINFTGIALKDTQIFLWSQCLGSVSALLYDRFLLGRFTKMTLLAAVVGAASTIGNSELLFYAGIGIRTINYQWSFWLFCRKNAVF